MVKRIFLAFSACLLIFSVSVEDPVIGVFNGGEPYQFGEDDSPFNRQLVLKMASSTKLSGWLPGNGEVPGVKPDFIRKYQREIQDFQFHPPTGYYLLTPSPGVDLETFAERLRREGGIEAVSPNYTAHITTTIPNDPYFAYQYALQNTGQMYRENPPLEGSAGSDIRAVEAWDWTTGEADESGVVIAVLDTGVAGDHEDLQGKMVPGYNFIADNPDAYDDHGHGTLVASIAAANTDNGLGVAGVSWQALIMPVKCVYSTGYGSYTDIAAAIRFAVDNGARVINLSLGGRNPSFILEEACLYAYDKGALIIGSAGNQGGPVLYPAAYDDYCLAVAATDAHDQVPSWSNYGPQVDVAAPGVEVMGALFFPIAPQNLDRYGYSSGTSYAAPYVAGAAALLFAYKTFLTPAEAMELIKITADDVNGADLPGEDDFIGYGRINLQTLLSPYVLN